MLTNVHEYDDINRLTYHIMLRLILCPLAETAYRAIVRFVFVQKFHFSVKCLDPKAKSEKRFKTEC